jgi:hypothetical protein
MFRFVFWNQQASLIHLLNNSFPVTYRTMAVFKTLVLAAALFSANARAACTSYGIDFNNGGTYILKGTSDQYITFTTSFDGESIYERSLKGYI